MKWFCLNQHQYEKNNSAIATSQCYRKYYLHLNVFASTLLNNLKCFQVLLQQICLVWLS